MSTWAAGVTGAGARYSAPSSSTASGVRSVTRSASMAASALDGAAEEPAHDGPAEHERERGRHQRGHQPRAVHQAPTGVRNRVERLGEHDRDGPRPLAGGQDERDDEIRPRGDEDKRPGGEK